MLSYLKTLPRWVCYRADKIPLRAADGWRASNQDPKDWTDYVTAKRVADNNVGVGVGFVLIQADNITCIDLDNPLDPKFKFTPEKIAHIQAVQLEIFNKFDTYAETSPSGKGCHLWMFGSVPAGKKRDCVEVYSSGRYMTITEDAVRNIPLTNQQHLLDKLYAEMGGAPEPAAKDYVDLPATQPDEEIYRLSSIGGNGNGEMFLKLWAGQYKEFFGSQSEADLALCNIVAFYTDNREQVGRLFLMSALGQREKAKRPEYLYHEKWGIVTKAFDRKGPVVDLKDFIVAPTVQPTIVSQQEIAVEPIEDDEDEVPETNWLRPPGMIGDIAEFIYRNAVNPVTEVSVAAAIAYMAGICGRGYNYSHTGLNQYIILLAKTAGGKEGAAQGMDKLTNACVARVPKFANFIGPGTMASPQGLIKELVESPCFISHKDEIGLWLQKLTGKYAKSNETDLRSILLALYTKSGRNQTLRGAAYSDRAKNIPPVESPAFTLYGDTTQQEFYKSIDEENISEGLVARFTVIEARDQRPSFNQSKNAEIPPSLLINLCTLAKKCIELNMTNQCIDVETAEGVQAMLDEYREMCVDKAWADRNNPILQLWTRANLRMLRLAALAAVGEAATSDRLGNPVVTQENVLWAQQVIQHGMGLMIKRFASGKVGMSDNGYLEQHDTVKKAIKKFINTPYNLEFGKTYRVTHEMHQAKVVPYSYIQNATRAYACFRKDRNPIIALNNILKEFAAMGLVSELELEKTVNATRSGRAYRVLAI